MMIKTFITIIFFPIVLIIFIIILNGVCPNYPEPTNFKNYGFSIGNTYIRTSNRNPFTSYNRSNKDTLLLIDKQDRWLKFSNGEFFELHSDSINIYTWKRL